MATTEPLTGAHIAQDTDSPLGGQVALGISDMASFTIPRFATTAARDSAYSSWAAGSGHFMTGGLYCTVAGRLHHYINGAWEVVPTFLGFGTAYPTSVTTGDTFYHNGLSCLMVVSTGGGWRQVHPALKANATERQAISTTYSAAIHDGFVVRDDDTNWSYTWSSTYWQPVESQDWSGGSVDAGNTAVADAWQGYQNFGWQPSLGPKVVIPADKARRIVKMVATCNVAGDGYLRIRADISDGTFRYWPNSNGKRTVTSANQEQDITFLGRQVLSGDLGATIYLEAKATTQGSATFIIPVLDITAI